MYGITKHLREYALKKIDRQKEFLSNNSFQVGADIIPMIKLFKNAYINPDRYIAEVNHRAYSLNTYALMHNLKPIFGTITLPSEYHKSKTLKNGKIISNPRYCNKNKIPDIERVYDIKTKKHVLTNLQLSYFSPHEGAKKLSKMFKALIDLPFLKNIPKQDKCYFRVYEPQQDGTPHIHFSFFVPEYLLQDSYFKMQRYFSKNHPKLQVDFQINIDNPVAYLMKYILKTFDDLRQNPDNISDLSLWYIAHKITRFYTSRTLMTLEVYRKLNGRYNLLELTTMFKNKEINYFVDCDTNAVLQIVDKHGDLYVKKPTTLLLKDDSIANDLIDRRFDLNQNGTLKDRQKDKPQLSYKNVISEFERIYDIKTKKHVLTKQQSNFSSIPIYINNKKYFIKDNQVVLQERLMCVNDLIDNKLISYYYHLVNKFDKLDNYSHFAIVKNEMIKRQFLNENKLNPNDMFDEFGF
jgi:hypothetical protein